MRIAIRRTGKTAFLAAFLAAGCFTEVGNPDNPEVKVEMSFSIDYRSRPPAKASAAAPTASDITIDHFYLDVYDAEYWQGGSKLYLQTPEGEDWNDQNGNHVDITGRDSLAKLPILYGSSARWDLFYFSAQVKNVGSIRPDTLDYAAFKGKNWMKGAVARSGGDLAFLYELPPITRIYLVLRDTTLERKRTAEGYGLDVAFRAKWFRAAIPWDSLPTVRDRLGRPFAYLSAKSNGGYYDRLKEGFRKSFAVDTAQIDGIEPVP